MPFCTFRYTNLQALPASQPPVAIHITRLMQRCHSGQLTTLLYTEILLFTTLHCSKILVATHEMLFLSKRKKILHFLTLQKSIYVILGVSAVPLEFSYTPEVRSEFSYTPECSIHVVYCISQASSYSSSRCIDSPSKKLSQFL